MSEPLNPAASAVTVVSAVTSWTTADTQAVVSIIAGCVAILVGLLQVYSWWTGRRRKGKP